MFTGHVLILLAVISHSASWPHGPAWWLVPGLPLGAALALGAVVAPPDAVSAVAIGRRLGLPRRVMTVLAGESLFNDATALTVLRVAPNRCTSPVCWPWW